MPLENLLKVGEQYPIEKIEELTHPTEYLGDLIIKKVIGRNEYIAYKQYDKVGKIIFAYNPNDIK